jgi:hypothetical protein
MKIERANGSFLIVHMYSISRPRRMALEGLSWLMALFLLGADRPTDLVQF